MGSPKGNRKDWRKVCSEEVLCQKVQKRAGWRREEKSDLQRRPGVWANELRAQEWNWRWKGREAVGVSR